MSLFLTLPSYLNSQREGAQNSVLFGYLRDVLHACVWTWKHQHQFLTHIITNITFGFHLTNVHFGRIFRGDLIFEFQNTLTIITYYMFKSCFGLRVKISPREKKPCLSICVFVFLCICVLVSERKPVQEKPYLCSENNFLNNNNRVSLTKIGHKHWETSSMTQTLKIGQILIPTTHLIYVCDTL